MNNEKIGKFIAKLRKAKGLTQQQLGDMVGVGGKSVSKWERGINMPDISIINEVSRILDITSDELLKGEFDSKSTNKEYKKIKIQKRKTILLFLSVILAVSLMTLLFLYFKNDTHRYWITSTNDEFSVNGSIEFDKHNYKISINKIYCRLDECRNLYLKIINYSISINDVLVYKNYTNEEFNQMNTIDEYLNSYEILFSNKFEDDIISYNDLLNLNKLYITIEGYYINEKPFKHLISLSIDDKNW